ncbi:Uncharacterised protein [Serratia marcescens]|nr:Uncharacterised protein [Serratia marcescens]
MVMERVAAGPVHQVDIRVLPRLAAKLIGFAGVQQHVADARHRDRQPGRVFPYRHGRRGCVHARVADAVHRAVAEREAAARQAHLAQHRRQRDHHPIRLLAAVRALYGVGTGDKTAHADQLPRQQGDARRRNAGNGAGPGRRFRHAVAHAVQVIRQLLIAHAVAAQEGFVLRAQPLNFVSQRQHQRHVGIRPDRDPLRVDEPGAVVAHRADVDNRRALVRQLLQPGFERMLRRAAGRDLGIFQRQPAKRHKQLAMLHHAWPTGDAPGQRRESADHIRQEKLRRAPAVVALLIDPAAAAEIEPSHQRARMMQAPGRRPAIRAGKQPGGAVAIAHPAILLRHQIERQFPVHFDEIFPAAQRAVAALALLQPRAAHRRLADTFVGVNHRYDGIEQRRRVGIVGEGFTADKPAVFNHGGIGAPMGELRIAFNGHGVLGANRNAQTLPQPVASANVQIALSFGGRRLCAQPRKDSATAATSCAQHRLQPRFFSAKLGDVSDYPGCVD